ncbi:MAG TPA: ATP-dependent RecD-like DNA helicase [Lactovum miscens]|uniref:SF1B family DNA helicase RecD2 n=1 Tax=Lactovum miscens TaxID=190387 RepID=UPI002ED7CEE7
MEEKLFFTGKIESIFFNNPSNLYKVLLVEIDDTNSESFDDSEIVVTGTIGDVVESETYTFYGHITNHPRYGEQLQVDTYEKLAPTTVNGLVKYLSSDTFPGIGKETAKKIVKLYPKNTVDDILENPEKLTRILKENKKAAFIKNLSTNHGMENILSKLYGYGLTGRLAAQIYKTYQAESLNIIKHNPYQLVEDIEGVGFLTTDKIASELGIEPSSPHRLKAALFHIVKDQPNSTGDTYIEETRLLFLAKEMLEAARHVLIPLDDLKAQLEDLIQEERLLKSEDKIFDKLLAQAEERIASNITRLLRHTDNILVEDDFDSAISEVEKKLGIIYDDLQKEAIHDALKYPIFILTGGPGTGKTTIINGFLQVYAQLNNLSLRQEDYSTDLFPFILAAPTGRASRRLSDLSGLPASTLHRTLGINSDDENEDLANDLSGEVLIVDEFSMVDTWLANKLFSAIPGRMKVMIVGDSDQLASVGPGQVLGDLLAFHEIPSLKLNHIYRQSEDSTITDLAHSIKEGKIPSDFTERKADRNFFQANSFQLPSLIGQIATSWKRKGNSAFDFQVLIPMYKGPAGITAINKELQDIFNPKGEGLEFNFMEGLFRKEDKVLQLVNDAENNVFNGDIGKIIELIPAKYSESKQDELNIDFDGQKLNYIRSDWVNIRLAYAISIHKSQGSEFEMVIVPMVSGYARMLQRNLVYTAITRARKSLIMLGEIGAFLTAVRKEGKNRRTSLFDRLVQLSEKTFSPKTHLTSTTLDESTIVNDYELSNNVENKLNDITSNSKILIQEMINFECIDPLIGLKDLDFEPFRKGERFLNLH